MKNGFDRLKGLAAASSIGLGLLTAGSARAISVTIGDSVRKNLEIIKTRNRGRNTESTNISKICVPTPN